jgi:hypothetical protein
MQAGAIMLSFLLLQTSTPAQAPQRDLLQAPPAPSATEAVGLDTVQLTLLRAQLATMREMNDDLLSTVHLSIGIVLTLALALVGYGWFTNFKVYERDKVALRHELLAVIREDASAVRESLTTDTARITKELEQRLQTLHKAAVDAGASAAQAGTRAAEGVREALNYSVEQFAKRFMEVEYVIADMGADSWQQRKVFTNDMRRTLEMLAIAGRLGHDFRVSRALDRLHVSFRAGAKPDAELAKEVVAALDRLPPEFVTEVESIKSALRAARQ